MLVFDFEIGLNKLRSPRSFAVTAACMFKREGKGQLKPSGIEWDAKSNEVHIFN